MDNPPRSAGAGSPPGGEPAGRPVRQSGGSWVRRNHAQPDGPIDRRTRRTDSFAGGRRRQRRHHGRAGRAVPVPGDDVRVAASRPRCCRRRSMPWSCRRLCSASSVRSRTAAIVAASTARRAGQDEHECGARPLDGRDVQVAAHRAGQLPGDRQPEARAVDPLVAGHPVEPLEDACAVFVGDAQAVVADREDRDGSVEPAGELHRSAGGRELQRIAEKVLQDLLDAPAVAAGGAQARWKLRSAAARNAAARSAPGDRGRAGRSRRPRRRRRRGCRLPDSSRDSSSRSPTSSSIEPTMSRLRSRNSRSTAGIVDVAGQDQLDIPAEARQRRAQLVRDRRHEPCPLDILRAQQSRARVRRRARRRSARSLRPRVGRRPPESAPPSRRRRPPRRSRSRARQSRCSGSRRTRSARRRRLGGRRPAMPRRRACRPHRVPRQDRSGPRLRRRQRRRRRGRHGRSRAPAASASDTRAGADAARSARDRGARASSHAASASAAAGSSSG